MATTKPVKNKDSCKGCDHFTIKDLAKYGECRRYPIIYRKHCDDKCGEFK
jgi:hypothetical protein